jgi:hypothetical protein
MDIQTASLSDLERYLADLRVRFNSGDKTVENRLRAVAARVEQLKALDPNLRPAPITTRLQNLARAVTPLLRKRCCG